MSLLRESTRRSALLGAAGLALSGCGSRSEKGQAVITFSRIPQADEGGRDKNDIIEGGVTGALLGE
jgi:hypothetical protein